MYRPGSTMRGGGGAGFRGGLTGPVPRDIWILLGVVVATLAMQYAGGLQWIPALLKLTPAVWLKGFVWQLLTYPFVANGGPNVWFVIELVILLLFSRDVYWKLGQRSFWRLVVFASLGAAVVATLVAVVSWFASGGLHPATFTLLQGQRALLTIFIAAFATLNAQATILLFFVLPVEAKWFLGLEILFAFFGFLSTGDLAGFLGICAAVGLTYLWLRPGSWRSRLREPWLRLQELVFRQRLKRMRQKSGLRIVKPGEGSGSQGRQQGNGRASETSSPSDNGPWVN